jgi:hypothetical protein
MNDERCSQRTATSPWEIENIPLDLTTHGDFD